MEFFLAILPMLVILVWAIGGIVIDTIRWFGWWFLISSVGIGLLISGWMFFWLTRSIYA